MAISEDTLFDKAVVADADFITQREIERAERRRTHKRDTEEMVRQREAELETLREARHRARLELCARLGDFGFAYEAKDHSITKISLVAPPDPESLASSPAAVAEPFDPIKYGLPPRAPEASGPKCPAWIDGLAWAAVLPLGAFVGYSIGMLAGLPVKASLAWTLAAVLFGAFLLGVMKGSLYTIVHHAVRRSDATGYRSFAWSAFAIAALLIFAEVGLGTVAIHQYSVDRATSPDEILPYWQTLLVALCFSTPMLVASAVKGWSDGARHDGEAERAVREAREHHAKVAAALREHEETLRQKDEAARERRTKALADFEAANEKHREDERWKTAMSLYGAIGCFDREIQEREELLKGFKISRGFSLVGEAKER